MKLHDTLSGELKELTPLSGKRVTMYVCGITPYDSMHLGHARTYISFDVMRRFLRHRGFDVFAVQNVTDVDDKIIRRAKETNQEPLALSAKFDKESRDDMDALNISHANVYPKVSEHIKEIESLISKLIERGFAYANESGVYFEVDKFSLYGRLSRQKMDEVKSGARIEVDEKKKNPADFALWKTAKPGELAFDSVFGKGRPGWHIECSAMSLKHIGETVDIHGGARDLIFPHHENEIAQSEGATGKEFVRYWTHTGFLTVGGEKMAKSLGNFVTVKDMLKQHDANTIRLFFASTHYRSPIDFSKTALLQAETNVKKIFNTLSILESLKKSGDELGDEEYKLKAGIERFYGKFIDSMDNDLDTPIALATLFELVHWVNAYIAEEGRSRAVLEEAYTKLNIMLNIFGIKRASGEADEATVAKLEYFITLREKARREKNYPESDRIRDEVKKMGFILEDGKNGKVIWKRAG